MYYAISKIPPMTEDLLKWNQSNKNTTQDNLLLLRWNGTTQQLTDQTLKKKNKHHQFSFFS